MEGRRFFDDHKKSTFVPKEEDREEDLIIDSIASQPFLHFVDTLQGLNLDQRMDIEHETRENKVTLDADITYEKGMKIQEMTTPFKFSLMQRNNSVVAREEKGHEEERKFDEIAIRQAVFWMKIFYRVVGHSQLLMKHVDAIDE